HVEIRRVRVRRRNQKHGPRRAAPGRLIWNDRRSRRPATDQECCDTTSCTATEFHLTTSNSGVGPMIILSCIVSALSMLGAAVYPARKFRGTVTAASLLFVGLLLLYGPASLIYQLYYGQGSAIYRTLMASPYFDESAICLNTSIAIMFGCCVLAIEFCEFP